jgi:hypothetical protein
MKHIDDQVEFPLAIYENGVYSKIFYDIQNLETNLENFDTDVNPDTPILDAKGRKVRLKIHFMDIQYLGYY